MRIKFEDLHGELSRVLLKYGFTPARAEHSARLFAEASRDGVASHGLNRFPRFIEYIQKGYVVVDAEPKVEMAMGSLERWDGCLGPGNLNAWSAMTRAIALSHLFGIGCIAMRNTNHWMRGGAYGWQAAEAGCIGICFTNTIPNMPAWGTRTKVLGNNPLIIAIPREAGHVVFDGSMSQFSFGKIESYRREGRLLPVAGGFDSKDQLSVDPVEIEATGRVLPIGFWKGSALSLVLDMLAVMLSGGLSSVQIGKQHKDEYGLSQVFIAIDPEKIHPSEVYKAAIAESLQALTNAEPIQEGDRAYYPGEKTLQIRKESIEKGVLVDAEYWAWVREQ